MKKSKLWYVCSKCGISGVRLYTIRTSDANTVQHRKGVELRCDRHRVMGVGYARVYPKGWHPTWLDDYPDSTYPFPWYQFLTDDRQVRRRKRCAYHADSIKSTMDSGKFHQHVLRVVRAMKWRRGKALGWRSICAFSFLSFRSVFGEGVPFARCRNARVFRATGSICVVSASAATMRGRI